MPKWAGIVRVSHMGERVAGSDSFHADADQVAEVEGYASRFGVEVEFLPPELSVSGGLPIERRPSLRAAIEGVESGRYDGLIAANLKRLTRSRSGLEIWERVEAAGGSVHCAAENLDTSTPNGRFVRDIHLADAVREREEHVDRFERRRQGATAAGVWQRRQTPKGLRRHPETRGLVPDEEAESVRTVFVRIAAGEPVVRVAEELGMTPNGLRYLIRNRVYLGELKVGVHVNPEAHEAIVDEDTFKAANAALKGRARPPLRRAMAKLAGLVRCAACGHVMTRTTGSKGASYACVRLHSGGRCPSPAAISCRRIEEHVDAAVVPELRRIKMRSERAGGFLAARKQREAAERSRDAFLDAVRPEDVGAEAYRRTAQRHRDAVEAAQGEERAAKYAEPLSEVAGAYAGWSTQDQNTLLRSLLAAVVVRRANQRGGIPLDVSDRVRILAGGFDLGLPHVTRGEALGIVPLPFPDLSAEDVIGVPAVEDGLDGPGGGV